MKYEAVLFDMDGVILDSEPLHVAAFQTTLGKHGHSLSDADYKRHFLGKTDKAGLESYFKFINETVDMPVVMDEKARRHLELAGDQLTSYPGVIAIVRELAARLPLALVTGSLRAEADTALKIFGISDCFKVIVAAEDISHSKPSPEGYAKAAQALRVSPLRCAAVEDSPSGVAAAITAGADCIAVTNTHSASDLRNATIVVDRLELGLF